MATAFLFPLPVLLSHWYPNIESQLTSCDQGIELSLLPPSSGFLCCFFLSRSIFSEIDCLATSSKTFNFLFPSPDERMTVLHLAHISTLMHLRSLRQTNGSEMALQRSLTRAMWLVFHVSISFLLPLSSLLIFSLPFSSSSFQAAIIKFTSASPSLSFFFSCSIPL